MKKLFNFSNQIEKAYDNALRQCKRQFEIIDKIKEYNEQKMLKAFQNASVTLSSLSGSNGYGYDDSGRDKLDSIYAYMFNAEDALVRHNFVSGTHTLSVMLFGLLRPDDELLIVTGRPYDTIQPVLGIAGKKGRGSLIDFGVKISEVDLKDYDVDYDNLITYLVKKPKYIYIQRSCGYSLRHSLTNFDIKKIADLVRKYSPESIIILDNCYGEFIEFDSPLDYGVDIMAGSLIKNAGGAIAQTGGYIAGRKDLVELCSYRLTTVGTGKEIGCTLDTLRDMFFGAYFAPSVSNEAMKTAVFASSLFDFLGYEVYPKYNDSRGDIIQKISFANKDKLIKFCQGIQKGSFVDSNATPVPAPMPGYDSDIIMAAGAFTLGSSIELSADAPLREPYTVFLQGGLSFNSAKIGIMMAAENII